jgi:hypothetical protein
MIDMSVMKKEDVVTMSEEDAYALFAQESDPGEELYDQIRYGIDIKFDYKSYLRGNLKMARNAVRIYDDSGSPQTYLLSEFYTEMENRRKLMNKYLIERYCQDRVMKEKK